MMTLALIVNRQMQEAHPIPTLFQQLKEGQLIVFKRIPTGSWLTAGVPYFVEWKDKDIAYFRNAVTGSGTYDAVWAINQAILA